MSQEKATIQIGKSGVTDALVDELSIQLKKKKVVKISLSPFIEDRKSFSTNLAMDLGAELIDVRGRKIILYRD